MRSVPALGLFIALCASADAATVHHVRTRHHVIVRPSPTLISAYIYPNGVLIYRDDFVPGRRTLHDDPPAYNDPSRFGGAMLPNQ